MTTQYVMKAFKTTNPDGYVYWSVLNTPDMVGTYSGYNPIDLTAIEVDYTLETPIIGSGEKPTTGLASGDLTGVYPAPTVRKIQGTPVITTLPTDGQILTYVNADGYWEPKNPPASGGNASYPINLNINQQYGNQQVTGKLPSINMDGSGSDRGRIGGAFQITGSERLKAGTYPTAVSGTQPDMIIGNTEIINTPRFYISRLGSKDVIGYDIINGEINSNRNMTVPLFLNGQNDNDFSLSQPLAMTLASDLVSDSTIYAHDGSYIFALDMKTGNVKGDPLFIGETLLPGLMSSGFAGGLTTGVVYTLSASNIIVTSIITSGPNSSDGSFGGATPTSILATTNGFGEPILLIGLNNGSTNIYTTSNFSYNIGTPTLLTNVLSSAGNTETISSIVKTSSNTVAVANQNALTVDIIDLTAFTIVTSGSISSPPSTLAQLVSYNAGTLWGLTLGNTGAGQLIPMNGVTGDVLGVGYTFSGSTPRHVAISNNGFGVSRLGITDYDADQIILFDESDLTGATPPTYYTVGGLVDWLPLPVGPVDQHTIFYGDEGGYPGGFGAFANAVKNGPRPMRIILNDDVNIPNTSGSGWDFGDGREVTWESIGRVHSIAFGDGTGRFMPASIPYLFRNISFFGTPVGVSIFDNSGGIVDGGGSVRFITFDCDILDPQGSPANFTLIYPQSPFAGAWNIAMRGTFAFTSGGAPFGAVKFGDNINFQLFDAANIGDSCLAAAFTCTAQVYSNGASVSRINNGITITPMGRVLISGSTAERPTGIETGCPYYDTDLTKPIWWDGAEWKDAAGTTV